MTNSIELDNLSNSWDEHSVSNDHHDLTALTQVVAQAAPAEQAAAPAQTGPAAAEPVPVDVGGGAPAAAPPAANAPHEYVADASNVVKLPANVSIDNIKVDGHNLVLEQADGSVIVIKDGALHVPTFIIGEVEVPRVALIAALEASHVDVAFGADGSISAGGSTTSSAGGNFSVPPGGIGDGFGLSALLPPTALQFGLLDRRELFPSVVDRPVSVVATSLLAPDEAASETGLNGGPSQSPGSDAPSNAETSGKGTITVDAPDGIGSIVINGVTVTGVGQQIPGDFGYLTIVSYNPSTGAIEYNYTVTESVTHPLQGDGFNPNDTVPDNFSITVTDVDGDTASTNFAVAIVDDVPTAVADTDSVASGQFGPATGNVLVGGTDAVDANTTDGVADTKGADGATVVGVQAGNTNAAVDNAATLGVEIQGAYGKLTLAADGTYSYVRDAGTPGGVNDVFTYTIKDGDGDTSQTTLTIGIGDSAPHIDTVPATGDADTTVYEAGLTARPGEPAGSHAGEAPYPTTVSGAIDISSPDGVSAVSLQGVTITGTSAATATTVISNSTGTLTAWYEATTPTAGHIHYTYALLDDTGDTSNTTIPVSIGVTDTDPSNPESATGTLTITVVDDVPTAHADTDAAQSGQTVAGNVITDAEANGDNGADTAGADGIASIAWAGAAGSTVTGTYGVLTVGTDGAYSYHANPNVSGIDVFNYTVTDGDGDTSPSTLTITVASGEPQPVAATQTVNEAALDTSTTGDDINHGTVTGSNPSSTAETVTGALTLGDPDSPHVTNVTGATSSAVDGSPVTVQGTYGVLQIDQDGHYTYTLTTPFTTTPATDNGAETEFGKDVFTYTVTDSFGNSSTSTITIDIVDDVPTISAPGASASLTVDETILATNATASFASAFTSS
ncbi:Ig-like domain-containing protein, partial [Mesorhizobium australicum]|uniref:beta strand repeat-containing protein n=1 Tax=Mesorhizobium australicum TaxID=536018 RepID=UPI0033361A63